MNKEYLSKTLTRFYQIMVFNSILNSSQFTSIPYFSLCTRAILYGCFILGTFMWSMSKQKRNITSILGVTVVVAISLIVMKKSNSRTPIMMLLFLLIVYHGIEPRQFCKKYVEAAVAAMLLVLLLVIIGVFTNEYRIQARLSIKSIELTQYRYYLGFRTPTVPANYAFHIALAFLFYKQDDFKFKDALLILAPTTILYLLTYTKAAYFELLLAILMFCFLKVIRREWFKRLVGFLSIWFMPLVACIELYIANHYTTSNPVYAKMDELLTYRLSWVARAVKDYPIGLFGNQITWEADAYSESSQLVDMFYLRCAIQYGLVFLFVIIIGFMGISAYFKSQNNYYGCVIIFILATHSITDPQLLEYACVPLLIMLFTGYKFIIKYIRLKKLKGGNYRMNNNLQSTNRISQNKTEAGI